MTRNSEDINLVEQTEYTLLTNIDCAVRKDDPMRLECSAVLLTKAVEGSLYHTVLRGFGTEAAWPVFDMALDNEKHFPFTLKPFENQMVKLLTESGAKNIFIGTTLTLKDGPEFALYAEDSERPIDVFEQTGDICKLWDVLYKKTGLYWTSPYMPRLSYEPAPNSYQSQRERGIR